MKKLPSLQMCTSTNSYVYTLELGDLMLTAAQKKGMYKKGLLDDLVDPVANLVWAI